MKKVQYEEMLPHELEAALAEFPVAYVPVGSLEWHGRHLPLGNDSIKAHAMLVKVAEQFGGVVYPPLWFHADAFPREHLVPVYSCLFQRLKETGFRDIRIRPNEESRELIRKWTPGGNAGDYVVSTSIEAVKPS